MRVRVKYMLWLQAKAGVSEEIIEVTDDLKLVDVLRILAEKRPGLARYIDGLINRESEIIVLLNSRTPEKGLETVVKDADEVVLMPPVSGG